MAIVRIDYCKPLSDDQRHVLASQVNDTMQQVLGVPPTENYIVCSQKSAREVLHAPANCSSERLANLIFLQITLNIGRTPTLKETFFHALTDALAANTPFSSSDIFINLVEVARENWSFGLPAAR